MLQIRMQEFTRYDVKSLFEYLQIHEETTFEIVVPMFYSSQEPSNFNIFWDYHIAAWIGQLLDQLCTSFSYFVPCPVKRTDFVFRVECDDYVAFAELLRRCIAGVYYDINFQDDAAQFFSRTFDDFSIHRACWELLLIASHFLELE